ncbi:hypothetical protein JCM10212_000859 [Sporobolomyces blumeae]
MTPIVGNFFDAQQRFNEGTCSGGLSIGEWCSAARDTCCAVCPNAPITGPGTAIVMSLGTLMNLIFVLAYQSEAPYNLGYQVVATDGAFFGLLARLVKHEGTSEFHASFVPMAIMSCVPMLFAACLNDVPSQHSFGPEGQEALMKEDYFSHKASEGLAHTPLVTPGGRPKSISSGVRDKKHEYPRTWLPRFAYSLFTVHLVAWAIFFAWVYLASHEFSQSNCAEAFPLRTYRIVNGSLVASWLLFGVLVWILHTITLFHGKEQRDMLELIAIALHLVDQKQVGSTQVTRVNAWFHPKPADRDKKRVGFGFKSRKRSILRTGFSLVAFALWCGEYLAIWFNALDSFVLIGTNGFDYGQTAAVVGIVIPVSLIARAYFDYTGVYWKRKNQIWADPPPGYEARPGSRDDERREVEDRGWDEEMDSPRREKEYLAEFSSDYEGPGLSRTTTRASGRPPTTSSRRRADDDEDDRLVGRGQGGSGGGSSRIHRSDTTGSRRRAGD